MEHNFAFHNSHVSQYRTPFGAVSVGTEVNIKILVDKGVDVFINIINFSGKSKYLKMNWEGDSGNRALFSVKIDTSSLWGLNKYYFTLKKEEKYFYYGNNNECLGGEGKIYYSNPAPYQITVYEESYIPQWYKEGIIYQIFPDRFYNGNKDGTINCRKKNSFIYSCWDDEPMYIKNKRGEIDRWDFYGGNLRGVIEKLPYLKEMGVTIIYFNPIFESASCHKYDVGDYEKVDGMLGSEDDFKELCKKASKLGIKVILDGVFSHTGADSKYFNKFGNYGSVGAYQSKESEYYGWYRFFDYPDGYESWWGFKNQPNVDELNPGYLNYIVTGENSIVEKWLKLGASGWRLDVADELPDDFIELFKKRMKEIDKDSILIGEVWEDASNKVSYSFQRRYLYGKELDSVTNYPLRDSIIRYTKKEINSNQFVNRIISIYENYPIDNFYSNMNLLGNHDTERILTVLDNNKRLLEFAVTIQMIFPGVPLVYYGDEAGVKGGKDPFNRKPYPWGKEDEDVIKLYKRLMALRNNNEVLKKGSFDIEEYNGLVLIKREYKNSLIRVFLNNTNEDRKVKIKKVMNRNIINLANNEKAIEEDSSFSFIVEKMGCRILLES